MFLIIAKFESLHLFIQQSLRINVRNVTLERARDLRDILINSVPRDKNRLDYASERDLTWYHGIFETIR